MQLWKPALPDVTKGTHTPMQPLPVSADTLHLIVAFFFSKYVEGTRENFSCGTRLKPSIFAGVANRRLKMQGFYNNCFCQLVVLACPLGVCDETCEDEDTVYTSALSGLFPSTFLSNRPLLRVFHWDK